MNTETNNTKHQTITTTVKVLEETLSGANTVARKEILEALSMLQKSVLTPQVCNESFCCDERNDAIITAVKVLTERLWDGNTVHRFEIEMALDNLDCNRRDALLYA